MRTRIEIGVLAGALALLGLVCACVDPLENRPEYAPTENTVNAMSVINIAPLGKSNGAQTKQSASEVQYDGTFRGVGNVSLFAIVQKNGNELADGQILKSVENNVTRAAGYFRPSAPITSPVTTFPVTFPVGTNTLLFYGEVLPGNAADPLNAYGALGSTFHKQNLWEIGCWAKQRLEETKDGEGHLTGKAADFQEIENIILCVYNHLLKIGFNGGNKWDAALTGKVGSTDMTNKVLHWSDYKSCLTRRADGSYIINRSPMKDVEAKPLEIALGHTYWEITAMAADERCAGSGADVASQVQAIYSVLKDADASVSNPNSLTDQEKVAQLMIGRILTYIETFFTITNDRVECWKNGDNVNSIVTAINENVLSADNAMDASRDFGNYSVQQFPLCFDLPMGAAMMQWSESEGFQYVSEIVDLLDGTTMQVYDFTYPPSLVYYGNAPVRITYDEITETSFPDNKNSWMTEQVWNDRGWASGYSHLTPTASGIAMAYNIGYGNALMETTVRFKDAVLYDNNAEYHANEQPNAFTIGPNVGLTLTGILIGGQPDMVDYTYLPKSSEISRNNRTIYDKYMCAKDPDTGNELSTYDAVSGRYSLPIPTDKPTEPVYTAVFDNYNPAGRPVDQREVMVAIELRNDLGKDFWGENNIVRAGGTFYLVGKLSLSAAKKTSEGEYYGISWPSEYDPQVPPYNATDGQTLQIVRVFMQGRVTYVTFSIDQNSLKYAKVTVPNLRSSNLTMGLSVDYYWQSDIPFDNVVLGAQSTTP